MPIDSKNQELSIFQVPQDIFLKNMPFHPEDIKNLSEVCSGFSFFRKPSVLNKSGKADAYLLMDKVIKFCINDAVEIVKNNPQALFEQICYEPTKEKVKEDSSPLNPYSPLQRAFMDLDSYMRSSLYEVIKDEPELLAQYKNQLLEVNQHFDIKPLVSAYDTYLQYYKNEKPDLDKKTNNPTLYNAFALFRKIRIAQNDLPMHMIYEMCRPGIHLKRDVSNFQDLSINLCK